MGTLTGYDSRIAYLVLDCYSFVHTDGCRKCNATILSFRDYASHPRVRCIHRPATAARHRILPTLERPTLPVPPRSGHGTTVCTVLDATAGNGLAPSFKRRREKRYRGLPVKLPSVLHQEKTRRLRQQVFKKAQDKKKAQVSQEYQLQCDQRYRAKSGNGAKQYRVKPPEGNSPAVLLPGLLDWPSLPTLEGPRRHSAPVPRSPPPIEITRMDILMGVLELFPKVMNNP